MSHPYIMAGVMGWPVSHSRSPLIHNHWISQYQLHGGYGLFPVRPEQLGAAIRGIGALGLAGCNITIPHKVHAMSYLDWVDPKAQRIGAVNAIVLQSDGTLHGYNHDGDGYIQSLRDVQPSWTPSSGPVVVLGAGGAARSILVSLQDEGAQEVRLLNRTRDKAEALADEFGPLIQVVDWSDRHQALAGANLLINTTSLGMKGQPELDLHLDELPVSAMVSDIIYTPLETPLLAQARQRGHLTANGLGMLLHQARPAFEAWFHHKPEISDALITKLRQSL